MSERAKILHNGDDQALQLPKSCRFPADQHEVLVRKEGERRLVVEAEPAQNDEWSPEFHSTLGAWDEEIERPPQGLLIDLRDPFADYEE
jgi:virulence-associated protein VagC